MTTWLKRPQPDPKVAPAAPASVDIEKMWGIIEGKRALGIQTPAQAYLALKAPAQPLDQWGMPLPLSSMDQDKLDRIFAMLADPHGRTVALLHSGRLCPDEVEPVATVFPEVWETICQRTQDEMIANPPPYPAWSEATIGVLFQKPAASVYNPVPEKPMGSPPHSPVKAPEATQADRRELAVREKR